MKALIIGSDSFIAQKFITQHKILKIKGIARSKTSLDNEIVVQDFFSVDETVFQDIDVVINFAAIVHQPKQKDKTIYDLINNELPVFMAQRAKEKGVKHFVQMSSIAVYGEQDNISLGTPYNPSTPYGSSKLKADEALLGMQDDYLQVSIIRPSMVYGGGAAPGNMLQLIKLANKRLPLPFKAIKNSRQFCHIGLLIDALTKIVEQKKDGVFLVADQKGVSSSEILTSIESFLNKKVWQLKPPSLFLKLLFKFKPSLYQKLYGSLQIDSSEIFNELGIDADKHTFSQGIREMVAAFKTN